jgi:hypothetical protein
MAEAEVKNAMDIVVRSNPDAELFLVRGDLQLVARGVGELHTRQPSGLYKARVVRAGVVEEKMFRVADAAVNLSLEVGNLVTKAGAWESSEVLGGLLEQTGEARRITLIVFDDTGLDDPFDGLTLRSWEGGETYDRPPKTTPGPYGRVSVKQLPVDKNGAILEIRSNGKVVQEAVPLFKGREARVFVRRNPWNGQQGGKGDAREWSSPTNPSWRYQSDLLSETVVGSLWRTT